MRRHEKLAVFLYMAAIASALALCAAAIISGCAGATVQEQTALSAKAASCEAKLTQAIITATSCTEAQLRADALVRADPDCMVIYADAGLDVCGPLKKGDAGHD